VAPINSRWQVVTNHRLYVFNDTGRFAFHLWNGTEIRVNNSFTNRCNIVQAVVVQTGGSSNVRVGDIIYISPLAFVGGALVRNGLDWWVARAGDNNALWIMNANGTDSGQRLGHRTQIRVLARLHNTRNNLHRVNVINANGTVNRTVYISGVAFGSGVLTRTQPR